MATMHERVQAAQSSRDPARMAALFGDDYDSAQPAHPGRAFRGRAQVFLNWTAVFQGVPDFTSELLATTTEGDWEWGEWHWHGHHLDGSDFAMRGVTILEVRDGRIASGRLYMEPVEVAAEDITATLPRLYGPSEE